MKFRSTWPNSTCPDCGGPVLRVTEPRGRLSLWAVLLTGAGELVVWIAIAVGFLVAHWIGTEFGAYVGLSVGVALCVAAFLVLRRHEKSLAEGACSKCHRRVP